MKKLFSFVIVVAFGVTMSCEDSFTTSPKISQLGRSVGSTSVGMATQSCGMSGSPTTYKETGSYNCHQYVKGGLVMRRVNLSTGEPDPVDFSRTYDVSSIQQSNDFLRVCSVSDAKAIAHLPQSADHSMLITAGNYSYSYPGAVYINASGQPLNYGTACDYEYYAAIPDVNISGPTVSGGNYSFTLTNRSNYSFILQESLRWVLNTPSSFREITRSSDQFVITPINSNISGTFTLTATINSSATENPTGDCAKGVNKIETATVHPSVRTTSFTVTQAPPPPDCSGTLDNGPLYTFNTVTHGVQHKVVMHASSWTWVKTGGNATWYGYGNTLTFTISSGYATFNAYGSGCNLTMTFYAN